MFGCKALLFDFGQTRKLTAKRCLCVCQAMRVTQELPGKLKLEAYAHLLQELLVVQLQQVTTIATEGMHGAQLAQVGAKCHSYTSCHVPACCPAVRLHCFLLQRVQSSLVGMLLGVSKTI